MKLLSIRENKGYFLSEDGGFEPIDKIGKDDLLRLVNVLLTVEAEIDPFDPGQLQNQAHQIIYRNLSSKLVELSGRKAEFLDEAKRLFLTDYERYKSTAPQEALAAKQQVTPEVSEAN